MISDKLVLSEELGEISADSLSAILGRDVKKATIHEMNKMGGMSAEFRRVDIQFSDCKENPSKMSLVLKTTDEAKLSVAVSLGTTREAFFFAHLAPKLSSIVPRSYHHYGDMTSGHKQLLLEYLQGAVPAGILFGYGNPNNWGLSERNHAELVEKTLTATSFRGMKTESAPVAVAADIFALYSKMHAEYWRDDSILRWSWLRGTSWMSGEGRDAWEAAQDLSKNSWTELRDSIHASEESASSALEWDEHLTQCLDVSFSKANWKDFQSELRNRDTWTLVHGDAHPHNVLVVPEQLETRLAFIDFEMVGVGSNAQELGQFLVSHMDPETRRAHERDLVQFYHTSLRAALRERGRAQEADAYNFDSCWDEYVKGGAARWIWFVPYLAKACPPKVAQFFINQLAAFLRDHIKAKNEVPMPRV